MVVRPDRWGAILSKRVTFEGPLEPLEPAGTQTTDVVGPSQEHRAWGAYLIVVGVLLAVVFAGLWLNARSDLNEARAKIGKLEAGAKARLVAPDTRPDLLSIARSEFAAMNVGIHGGADSVEITIRPPRTLDQSLALRTVLRRLGFDYAAVSATMSKTRDVGHGGTGSAQGRYASASWTYGPGDGLRIVFVVLQD